MAAGAGPPLLLLLAALLLGNARAQKGDGCGYTVMGPESGTFTSINYPQTYPNSTVCEWEIRVKSGDRIHLKFGDFDIEDSNSCHFNYLKVYNGIGPTRSEIDLITCLEKASRFSEPEYSKYCPAGCLTPFGDISGTIPHGYRDSSSLCMAGVHAGVVSNKLGGQISVVISKGIPYYESSLANNVTSRVGPLSASLFTFKTSGCYGTLGMESGVIPDSQLAASSILEWTDLTGETHIWSPEQARMKKHGPPWASYFIDENQWLQIDLNKFKKITGIITTGSTMAQYNFYVSMYRILYSDDGKQWSVYKEPHIEQEKLFQGNTNYYQEVRNNFIPILTEKTTFPPEIKNTTMTPHVIKDVALAAILVPVLVMVLTSLILILVCAWHWRNRRRKTEGTYELPYWDRAGWWKGVKQFLPAKSAEHEETPVRYSSSEVSRLRAREVATMLQAESAEYAQPLVGGVVGTLHQRSTFKPEDGKEAGYADLDTYNSPQDEIYHEYAEPLPTSGPEYATPIVMDMSGHSAGPLCMASTSTFKAAGNPALPLVGTYNTLLSRTDSSSSARALYDTPKGTQGTGLTNETVYQVPQNVPQAAETKDGHDT